MMSAQCPDATHDLIRFHSSGCLPTLVPRNASLPSERLTSPACPAPRLPTAAPRSAPSPRRSETAGSFPAGSACSPARCSQPLSPPGQALAHRKEDTPVAPSSTRPPSLEGSPLSRCFDRNTSYIVFLDFPAFMYAKLGFPGNLCNKVCSLGIANLTLLILTCLGGCLIRGCPEVVGFGFRSVFSGAE